jgi:hypothetical protein
MVVDGWLTNYSSQQFTPVHSSSEVQETCNALQGWILVHILFPARVTFL